MTTPTSAVDSAFHHGHGAAMWHLADTAAALILTSPPYFPAEVEGELRKPIRDQLDLDAVEEAVTSFALSLEPVFVEMGRVLAAGRHLVIQTRDLRYGGFLLGPADIHRRLAEASGFRLVTEIAWLPVPPGVRRMRVAEALWRKGLFAAVDVEKFMVFNRRLPRGLERRSLGSVDRELAQPLWSLPGQGARATHPYESPLSVLRRLIALLTQPGELVVDPFCGHGTTVLAAVELGRTGVGYDVDPTCVDVAAAKLMAISPPAEGRP